MDTVQWVSINFKGDEDGNAALPDSLLIRKRSIFSELLMKRKMVAGDEEYKDCKESNLIFEVIIGITMTIFLIIYGGAFILATAV